MDKNNHWLGSLLLVAISFNAVINDIIMKTLAMDGMDPLAINGLRIFFSCIIALIISIKQHGKHVFKDIFHWHHWVRNIATIGALWAVIVSLSVCQIAQVDLITYLIPAFISIIAFVFFKEKFNGLNFLLVIGCIGTFLYRKGWFFALPLIVSAILFGFAEVWIKHKMHRYKFWSMVVSLGITGSLLLSYYFVPVLLTMDYKKWILSGLMGVGDITILGLITWKSKVGSSHDFLPLRYSSVLFAILADKFIFNGTNFDWIMVSVVIATSLISLWANNFKKKIQN
jgi:drug/metabolite transporter (DMT)-like permease